MKTLNQKPICLKIKIKKFKKILDQKGECKFKKMLIMILALKVVSSQNFDSILVFAFMYGYAINYVHH